MKQYRTTAGRHAARASQCNAPPLSPRGYGRAVSGHSPLLALPILGVSLHKNAELARRNLGGHYARLPIGHTISFARPRAVGAPCAGRKVRLRFRFAQGDTIGRCSCLRVSAGGSRRPTGYKKRDVLQEGVSFLLYFSYFVLGVRRPAFLSRR